MAYEDMRLNPGGGKTYRLLRPTVATGVVALAGLISLTACGRATPDAGHAIVLVEKPMFFGHGGVDRVPVQTGSEWIAPTTSTIDVSMVPERHDLRLNDLMTSDGVPLDFDAISGSSTQSFRRLQPHGTGIGSITVTMKMLRCRGRSRAFVLQVESRGFHSSARDLERRGFLVPVVQARNVGPIHAACSERQRFFI
jgi:hypothetical protein